MSRFPAELVDLALSLREAADEQGAEPAVPPTDDDAKAVTARTKTPNSAAAPSRSRAPQHDDRASSRLQLVIAPEARWFLHGEPLFGARAAVEVGPIAIGADMLANRSSTAMGDVVGVLLHGVLGVRLVRLELGVGSNVEVGVRVGGGIVSISGAPKSEAVGQNAIEPYVDGALVVGARRELGALELGKLELGYARGVVALADAGRVGVYGGMFVGALLSAHFCPVMLERVRHSAGFPPPPNVGY